MGSTLFRDPQARSSALAALGSLQPRAFGSLNCVDPMDSVSNYYLVGPKQAPDSVPAQRALICLLKTVLLFLFLGASLLYYSIC